ncbi:hypothetical protein MERGE_001712 [Pneumocystis wakefieldiae]|uniref:MADS-box domain-containing protein n=1 Tax=Pneumocystis wakefieldiae TaxID=38082 RepID=A0A899FRK0_9ASCO|nr:hypothetical protein MERGE_001712 [Pneumocystis wakefieldiae]
MGKKKIQIKKIMDPKTQITTFSRRRNGLLKKAHELSVLCGVEVAILIFDEKNKCHVYCSNEEENAAETLMHKYINKRFRTERSKKQAELVGLECQLDGAVVGKEGYNLSDGNDNVAVVQTYQVVANNNANKDASLPFTSEDCLDKIEGLYIRSKRTYHIHTESSKKGLEAECKGSDPYYFGQRSVPDFRLLSSFENISQNTAPMVHDNLTNSICNYSDHKF